MYHDNKSVIVLRLTALIEKFVICRYQATDLFGPRNCFASALPAKNPRNVGPLGDFAISVFREVSINTVLPGYSFSWDVPNLNHRVLALLYLRDYL